METWSKRFDRKIKSIRRYSGNSGTINTSKERTGSDHIQPKKKKHQDPFPLPGPHSKK